MKPLTDEFIDSLLDRNKNSGTYPASSQPQKECYEWKVCRHIVITSHPDDGYSLCIEFFNGSDNETGEIRKVKTEEDLIHIISILRYP